MELVKPSKKKLLFSLFAAIVLYMVLTLVLTRNVGLCPLSDVQITGDMTPTTTPAPTNMKDVLHDIPLAIETTCVPSTPSLTVARNSIQIASWVLILGGGYLGGCLCAILLSKPKQKKKEN